MSRTVPEWIATHDDQAIPRLVKARIWAKQEGRCALTGRKLTPADKPEFDHIVALADGGAHRELNLQLIAGDAHKAKTAAEAPRRAKERRIHAKHHGYWPETKAKIKSRGFGPSRKQATTDQQALSLRNRAEGECEATPNLTKESR